MRCSTRATTAAQTLSQLLNVLADRGEVTIRLAELGDLAGLTDFRAGVVYIDHRLSLPAAVAALGHELTHLARGPVPAALAMSEEVAVRQETADMLLPSAAALRDIRRRWTRAELDALAVRAGVDRATARDALDPPTTPIPLLRVTTDVA